MNYMIKEEWICPPSFAENLKPCAGAKTFSLKDGNNPYSLLNCHTFWEFYALG